MHLLFQCQTNDFQDVDFVSPPAPTSAFGDGQRGFRLEYRQIPCSTWLTALKRQEPDPGQQAVHRCLQCQSVLRRLVSNLTRAALNTALGLLTWVKLTLDILVKIRFISSLFMIFNSIIVMATKVVQEWIFVVISACSCHSKSHLGLWAPRHLKTQN